jgi:hypothetical protein
MARCRGALLCMALLVGVGSSIASSAWAQTTSKPRPFDAFPGIAVVCVPVAAVAWTVDACPRLIDEVKRRATAAKLVVSPQSNATGLSTRKIDDIDGVKVDRMIRMALSFAELPSVKGRVGWSLASNYVWEPTAQEIPGAVPGQRIPRNFYSGGATFEPGARPSEAEALIKQEIGVFFDLGEGKI